MPLTLAGIVAGATLIGMLIAAGTGDRFGRVGAAVLAALSLLWFFTNKPMEGSVLLELGETHGVTVADLLSLTGFGLAAWRWRQSEPGRRRLR